MNPPPTRPVNLNCSFLRPENFAAPKDGLQVQNIAVDCPRAYPGWWLCFLRENYEGNEHAQRITFQPRPYLCKRQECVAREWFLALRSSPYTRLSYRQIVRLEESSLAQVHEVRGPNERSSMLLDDMVKQLARLDHCPCNLNTLFRGRVPQNPSSKMPGIGINL